MEFGGNAPFIVYKCANIDLAVKCLLISKFRNAGQTCISPNRIFVHAKIYDVFLKKIQSAVATLKAGDPTHTSTQISCLYSDKGHKKVDSLVENAINEGAKCIYQGMPVKECGPFFYPPTILSDCYNKMIISQTEIFGPVCCIQK
uniref:Putative succinate-semialdehyde dehydrogenase C13905 [NADP(+)] (Trinotate prediction) n=1 Tax=Henneguya salminicola TaxID=69463 RepID=A0A6G3MH45_HENSL